MGYETERVDEIDHDATHGDPNERPTTTDPGTAAGLFVDGTISGRVSVAAEERYGFIDTRRALALNRGRAGTWRR